LSIPEHPDGRALWTAILTRYWMDDEAHKLSPLAAPARCPTGSRSWRPGWLASR